MLNINEKNIEIVAYKNYKKINNKNIFLNNKEINNKLLTLKK